MNRGFGGLSGQIPTNLSTEIVDVCRSRTPLLAARHQAGMPKNVLAQTSAKTWFAVNIYMEYGSGPRVI